MTNGNGRLSVLAVVCLAIISVLGLAGGVIVALSGSTSVGVVIAVVVPGISGIVAIVLRDK